MKSVPSARLIPGSNTSTAFRSRLITWLFMLGPGFFLISVFFEWRHTQATTPAQGIINQGVTAWETGLLGGQGFFLVAAVFLLIFPLLRRRLPQVSPIWFSLPFLVLFALLLSLTLQRVLEIDIGRNDLAHLHTYLGIGFYLTMIGCNLLLLAIFLAFNNRKSERRALNN